VGQKTQALVLRLVASDVATHMPLQHARSAPRYALQPANNVHETPPNAAFKGSMT